MADELSASLVLKLQDQLSGGLRKLQDQLEELTDVADKLKLNGLESATEQAEALNSQLTRTPGLLERIGDVAKSVGKGFQAMGGAVHSAVKEMTSRVRAFQEASANLVNRGFGAAAEGFAVIEPVKKFADYENIVRHIGITEGLSGPALDARIARQMEFFREDALKTGQSSESVAQAYQDLTQMGIHADLDTIIQAHSRAATAYNTTAEALGPAVGALVQTMKIPAGELGSAMAAMAQATKEGRFKIEDFSRELPGVAAQMATFGMTGRKSADISFAALETVMKNSSEPSQASTNLSDLLRYIRNPVAAKHFAKQGISLHDVLERGLKQGDVLGAVIDAVRGKVKGKDLVGFSEEFGKLFHNQQAGDALLALLQHNDDYQKLRGQLDKVDGATVERDFQSAFAAPAVQMRVMTENLEQLIERLGQGFLPVLSKINDALGKMNELLKAANEHFPKTTAWVLSGFAALLALGAALGLIGAIWPLIITGFRLLTGPLVLLRPALVAVTTGFNLLRPALIAAAAGFRMMAISGGLLEATLAVLFSPITLIIAAITAVGVAAYEIYEHWGAVKQFFVTTWEGVKQVFHAFVTWVDSWASGLGGRILNGIASGWTNLVSGLHNLVGRLSTEFDNSLIGRLLGLAQAKTQSPAAANDNGAGAIAGSQGQVTVRIQAEPGTNVTAAQSTGPVSVQAPITAPSRGATVGRP